MEVINEILIHMNILLMTSDVFFYIGGSIFRSFLTVIFYTFIFVKDEMHVDFFYITKGTLIFCICMAFRERLGLTQYLSVHTLCKKDACNMKSDFEWGKVHRYLTILTKKKKKKSQWSASLFFCVNCGSKFNKKNKTERQKKRKICSETWWKRHFLISRQELMQPLPLRVTWKKRQQENNNSAQT